VIPLKTWETIRQRCLRDGEEIKVVARDLNLAPNTLRKYLRCDKPPSRQRRLRACLLDRYQSHIDDLIRSTPKITAVRIGSYLRQRVDPELRVDERTLRWYVASRRTSLVPKEAFIRATYAPGDQAQFDFSPMSVMLAGVLVTVQLFVMRLSYSACLFARASFRCDQPSLFAGLLEACENFGGTPRTAIFDNATTAVRKILSGRSRDENETFTAFRGSLVLDVQFAAPGKGNEKGGVEGAHGFIEDNFFRPIPSFETLDELNVALATFCERDLLRTQTGQSQTIGERYAHERRFLCALPIVLPRACVMRSARIDKFSEIAFESNWYSAPTRYAHREAVVEVYEDRIRIIVGDEAVPSIHGALAEGSTFWMCVTTSTSCSTSIEPQKQRWCFLKAAFLPSCALFSNTTARPIHVPRPNAGRASWDCSPTLHSTSLPKPSRMPSPAARTTLMRSHYCCVSVVRSHRQRSIARDCLTSRKSVLGPLTLPLTRRPGSARLRHERGSDP